MHILLTVLDAIWELSHVFYETRFSTSEVRAVLRWGTAWEVLRVLSAFGFRLRFLRIQIHQREITFDLAALRFGWEQWLYSNRISSKVILWAQYWHFWPIRQLRWLKGSNVLHIVCSSVHTLMFQAGGTKEEQLSNLRRTKGEPVEKSREEE